MAMVPSIARAFRRNGTGLIRTVFAVVGLVLLFGGQRVHAPGAVL